MHIKLHLVLFIVLLFSIKIFGQQPPPPSPPPSVEMEKTQDEAEELSPRDFSPPSIPPPPPPPGVENRAKMEKEGIKMPPLLAGSTFREFLEKEAEGIERPDEYSFDFKLVGVEYKSNRGDTLGYYIHENNQVYGTKRKTSKESPIEVFDYTQMHHIGYFPDSKDISIFKIKERALDEEWIYNQLKFYKIVIDDFNLTGEEKELLGFKARKLLVTRTTGRYTWIEELWVTKEMGAGFPYLYENFTFDDFNKNPDLRNYAVLKHQNYHKENPQFVYPKFEIIEIQPFEKLDVSMYDTEPTYK